MRKICFIATFLFYFICFSQNNTGLIIYDIKYPNENPNASYVETRMFFNDTLSVSTAFSTHFYKNNKQNIEQEDDAVRVNFKYGDEIGELIHRNFNQEEITLRFPKTAAFDEFTVADAWVKIDWTITEDTMTIAHFKCKKGIGDFRGRQYMAWFTEEIPLPYGPWKLFGLPGLILEAQDSEQMFKVVLRGVQYPSKESFVSLKPEEKEKKTLQEYVYAMDNYEDFLLEKLRAKMPRKMAGSITKMPKKKDAKRKYKTERIFEWENQ